VLLGLESPDDAGVYQITDDIALIQTVDFFTPVVDDPYWFGQIAVANALSDVYAMGGVPITAMNLVAFPVKDMDLSVLKEILRGGMDKLTEAGASLVGGHSVEDKELKYGLSVTGIIHPDKILAKKGFLPGDKLVLTKPLGTGIINTAIKGGLASDAIIEKATKMMARLNRTAADVMRSWRVHACTDVTGFGMLGHLCEMVVGSGYGVELYNEDTPSYPEAREYAAMGLVPAGTYQNRKFREAFVDFDEAVDLIAQDILFDAQTSGGLMIMVHPDDAQKLVEDLHAKGEEDAVIIGEVIESPEERILVHGHQGG
jgi:selenide, water dikinase